MLLMFYFFCVQVLKLYAWEESFIRKVSEVRKKELKQLKNAAYLNASFSFTFTCAPFMVSYASSSSAPTVVKILGTLRYFVYEYGRRMGDKLGLERDQTHRRKLTTVRSQRISRS